MRLGQGFWPRLLEALRSLIGRPRPASLADLRGHRVAAWGGSRVTAENIRARAGVPYEVVHAATPADAQRMLMAGEVDAVLAVGGAPLKWVSLLEIGRAHV